MTKPFLTAVWSDLVLVTYPVDPELLQAHLPAGLELETRDGRAFVSLVAFRFLDTRVFGVPWPGYRNFTELNLRFYVRRQDERGVVFIREFVPKRLVAWAARLLYNEPYQAAPLTGAIRDEETTRRADYHLYWGGKIHTIRVVGRKPTFCPGEDSLEHHFKEHHWGYGRNRSGETLRYKVDHDRWDVLPIQGWHVDLDWGSVYGPEWSCMQGVKPISTIFAVGSPVKVFPANKLETGPSPGLQKVHP
jgi:uncharacterized protein